MYAGIHQVWGWYGWYSTTAKHQPPLADGCIRVETPGIYIYCQPCPHGSTPHRTLKSSRKESIKKYKEIKQIRYIYRI